MKYVAKLELHNWGPYRGTHTIELEPTVYAVVAQHENDPERSNWLGKTWFLSAILFALTGNKPTSCKTEDGWITHDELEGHVELTSDNGMVIRRERKRGRSTQLSLTRPGGSKLTRSPAQDAIYAELGVDAGDLVATSFIRQKFTGQIVTSDPSERTAVINGWLDLGVLQRAEEWLKERLKGLLAKERESAIGEPPDGSLKALKAELKELETVIEDLTCQQRSALDTQRARIEWESHSAKADSFANIRKRGRDLRSQYDRMEDGDPEEFEAEKLRLNAEVEKAKDRKYELEQLVNDEWDGKCPLMDIGCPATKEVVKFGRKMSDERDGQALLVEELSGKLLEVTGAQSRIRRLNVAKLKVAQDLDSLRCRARDLVASVNYLQDNDEPPELDRESIDQAIDTLKRAQARAAEVKLAIQSHRSYRKSVKERATVLKRLDDKIRTHREAIAIVGRQGAQREVAEASLESIESGANELLRQAGIDLSVSVQWAREGRGLASHCDSCGFAYGASQRVKACPICAAQRGPKLVEKLEIFPSDRSGAADDIAGLAFQLSAAAWLRRRRLADWSVACIDEPFGALDATNTRALSSHLHALIRGSYAFAQGFLVAHDSQVMESLPARITIHSGANGARLEVT